MDGGAARFVEQIEVIEHSVTEGRRPVSSEQINYLAPQGASYQTESDRRYQYTGERDVSREPSFMHHSSATGIGSLPPPPPITHSTPERHPGGVNNYGYDVHEVHTSEGGARIVETHGGGFVEPSMQKQNSSILMHDRSLDTTLHNQSAGRGHGSGQLQSILKSSDEWRPAHIDDGSLQRKDSYKHMQESQGDQASVYAPSSNATMITKGSREKRETEATGTWWQKAKAWLLNAVDQIRSIDWTSRSVMAVICLLLCLFLLALILFLIFNSLFTPYSVRSLLLYPPVCEECLRKNPSALGHRTPSKVFVHFASPAQAHFETIGNPPLKSNSFMAVDFETGFVAIADHALVDRHGRHTTCFLMELDRNALPNIAALQEGLAQSYSEVRSQFGWQEYWQYVPELIDASRVTDKFRDRIPDCTNVKWYFLKHTVYTRDESCTDCYDFCLPDYAVQRREKYDDHVTIGMRRLNCFRLYVPEWKRFQLKSDATGGHWEYPMNPEFTQRDADGNWANWNPSAFNQQPI